MPSFAPHAVRTGEIYIYNEKEEGEKLRERISRGIRARRRDEFVTADASLR